MFRIGGKAEGITSGLDTPKRGLVDGPGMYSQPAGGVAKRFKPKLVKKPGSPPN